MAVGALGGALLYKYLARSKYETELRSHIFLQGRLLATFKDYLRFSPLVCIRVAEIIMRCKAQSKDWEAESESIAQRLMQRTLQSMYVQKLETQLCLKHGLLKATNSTMIEFLIDLKRDPHFLELHSESPFPLAKNIQNLQRGPNGCCEVRRH